MNTHVTCSNPQEVSMAGQHGAPSRTHVGGFPFGWIFQTSLIVGLGAVAVTSLLRVQSVEERVEELEGRRPRHGSRTSRRPSGRLSTQEWPEGSIEEPFGIEESSDARSPIPPIKKVRFDTAQQQLERNDVHAQAIVSDDILDTVEVSQDDGTGVFPPMEIVKKDVALVEEVSSVTTQGDLDPVDDEAPP